MSFLKTSITRLSGLLLAMLCLSVASCDRLHEDLQPCISGARLRFVYDWNMEFANAFPSQVDCLTLLVYDHSGKYVRTVTAGRPETANEDWRMTIDLPAGFYHLVAWGGLDCSEASFAFNASPSSLPMDALEVAIKPEDINSPLHHLFYGALDIDIPQPGADTSYTEGTVYVKKDTNDVRLILGMENGDPTDVADFEFSIITDDTRLAYNNDLLPAGETTYRPFSKGNAEIGVTPLGIEAQMAYAELSISRLVKGNPTTLLITRKSDGATIVKIPLINLLLQYKSDRPKFAGMQPQEFLDRQSYWPITFLIAGEMPWIQVKIVVDDWVVRYNNAEMW